MKTVLALTYTDDDSATMVLDKLSSMGVSNQRFNTEKFHGEVKLTTTLESSGGFTGRFAFPERELPFDQISVVWNRRIHDPELGIQFSEPELQKWMVEESKWAMLNSFTLIPAPMVNPWEVNERLKYNKWVQMARAAQFGLEVPRSMLTNQSAQIWEFWEQTKHEMIFKKIRRGLFRFSSGQTMLVHTSKIPEEKMTPQNVGRMRYSPMFLQEHIPKKYDVRSVVVGDQVFSVTIDSQSTEDGKVDYRTAAVNGRLDQMKHQVIDLGSDVNKKLIMYSRSFGLSFGAIDLIITPDDRLVFLEDNPNGQWGWLEHKTGLPISQAFADYLAAF